MPTERPSFSVLFKGFEGLRAGGLMVNFRFDGSGSETLNPKP